jgi:hypothetical protein
VIASATQVDVRNFVWRRDLNGYRLWKGQTRVVASGAKTEDYKPLERNESLFGRFASIQPTPVGLLEFITKFGPLTAEGLGSEGENVQSALDNARAMAAHLRATQTGTSLPEPLEAPHSVRLAVQIGDAASRPTLRLMPETLLDALWLQVTEALAGDCQIRHCLQCNSWFAAGGGFGRRHDSKFCSDEHRVLFNSQKRNMKSGGTR